MLVEAAHPIVEYTVDGTCPAGYHVIVVGMVRAVERFHLDSALLGLPELPPVTADDDADGRSGEGDAGVDERLRTGDGGIRG